MPGSRFKAIVRQIRQLVADDVSDAVYLGRFVANGDQAAFAELVRRHGALVRRVCQRVLGQRDGVDDAFQATFVVLARKAASIRKPASLRSWLHGVAYRIARDARSRMKSPPGNAIEASGGRDPAQEAAWRELGAILEEEVHALPEKLRLPILMCYWEGRTNEESARALGWAGSTFKARLARARQRLHDRLVRRGVTLPAGAIALLLAPRGADAALSATMILPAVDAACRAEAKASVALLADGALSAKGLTGMLWALALVLLTAAAGVGTWSYALQREEQPDAQPPQAAAKPEPPAERSDLYGDPLPPGALSRLGTLRWRQGLQQIHQFALAPDGKTIATAALSTVSLWDLATGRKLRHYEHGTTGDGSGVAFAPDGNIIASAHDSKIHRWDVRKHEELPPFTLEPGLAGRLFYSPDGLVLASIGMDRNDHTNTIIFLDAITGRLLHRHNGRKNYITPEIAFAPDGKSWAHVDRHDSAVTIYDSATGRELRRLAGHSEEARSVAFSPDGKTLASTDETTTLRFWDMPQGTLSARKGTFWVTGNIAYSPDGKKLTGWGTGGKPVVYDIDSSKETGTGGPGRYGDSLVLFAPDGRTLVSAHDRCLLVWDALTLSPHRLAAAHEREVSAVAFMPDAEVVITAGGDSGFVRRWEARSGKPLAPLGDVEGITYGCALAPDGHTLAAASFGDPPAVCLFDTATSKRLRSLPVPGGHVVSMAFAADGRTLVSGQGKDTRLWDVASGKLLHTYAGGSFDGACYALSPDGRILATGGLDGAIRLWEAATGKPVRQLAPDQAAVTSLVFSPDNKVLASAGHNRNIQDFRVKTWDVATGAPLWESPAPQRWLIFLAFSPDGRTLASGDADVVRLWEMSLGRERWSYAGHGQQIRTGVFSRDGRRLATGSADTTVLVWDLDRPTGLMAGPLSGRDLDSLWNDLAGEPRPAYQAIAALACDADRSVGYLRTRLAPATVVDDGELQSLLRTLNSDDFTSRQNAMRRLQALGASAEVPLRRALADPPSAEVRLRVQQLLDALSPRRSPAVLRSVRAIEVLERIDDAPARELLAALGSGVPEALLTQEAKAALGRLEQRTRRAN